MANIFTPGSPTLGPWRIEGNDCIDTSLDYINANTNYVAYNTQIINSYLTTITPSASGQPQVATLYELTNTGVTGGDASGTGTWIQRRLNTLKQQPSNLGVTLNSNQFTLPAGKWLINASAPAYRAGKHQIRLYRINPNPGVEIFGTIEYCDSGYFAPVPPYAPAFEGLSRSFVEDIINISQPTTYQIEHIIAYIPPGSYPEFGISNYSSWGGIGNVYTTVTCTKVGYTDIS